MPNTALTVAARFAAALDVENYPAARALLSESCTYDTGNGTLANIDVIIASYSDSGERAKERFDAVEYASRVESTGPDSAVIGFTDRVCVSGRWHEYHCRQHVRVGPDGLIEAIRHEEIPGQRDRLDDFERRQCNGC